jgi:hypothetical protein
VEIKIQNKLEVFPGPNGGIIHVPGSEPVSNHSGVKEIDGKPAGLAEAMRQNGRIGKSIISLRKALEVIPGSTVERWLNSGGSGPNGSAIKFFVLPDGPPQPSACTDGNPLGTGTCSVNDWYKILADNADSDLPDDEATPDLDQICSTFTFRYKDSELF